MNSKALLFWGIILTCNVLQAQSQSYEIRAMNKGGGYVGVEMRVIAGTAPSTANYVTDLVFGLKWLSSYNVDIVSTITTSYNIVKSDVRKTKGAYYYQSFSAANTPFLFPADWTLNGWVEIMSVRNTLTGTGVGTFEVVESGFDATTEPNLGVDLVDYRPSVVGSAVNVPLPVKLTRFKVTADTRQINVEWTTEEEQNSRGFEVERTGEDSSNFKSIGWVVSKGSKGGEYQWKDKEVIEGVRYYYRLRQVDKDEGWRLSETRTVKLEEVRSTGRIMPNPVDMTVQLLFGGGIRAERAVISVWDARGVEVLQRICDVTAGRKVELDVGRLISGQYFLSVHNSQGLIFSKAFMKR